MSRTLRQAPDPDRGREIAERRRSNAAGTHGSRRRNRRNANRLAIAASMRGE